MKYDPKIHHRRSIRLKGYDYSQAGMYFITICTQNMKCWFGEIENGEMILNDYGISAYNQWVKLTERFLNFELDVFQIMPNHMHGIILLSDSIVVKEDRTDSKTSNITIDKSDDKTRDKSDDKTRDKSDDKIIDKSDDKTRDKSDDKIIDSPVGATLAVAPKEAGASPAVIGAGASPVIGAGASPAPTVGDMVGAYKSLTAIECLEIFKQKYPGKRMGNFWQRNYYEHIIRDDRAYHNISNYIINNPANWNGDKFYLR